MHRRDFIKRTGLSIAAVSGLAHGSAKQNVSLVIDPADRVADTAPVRWAAQELEQALTARGVAVGRYTSLKQAPAGSLCVVAGSKPGTPESVTLGPGSPGLLATGGDSRGLMYALLELADRVRHAADPAVALVITKPAVERPENEVRSVARLFTSDVEDKPWFNDREMWPAYFSMLAGQRFNRFHLALGIGYDFLREVTDAYFVFAYPFFVAVPGYNVRAVNLPEAERDRNLDTLKFVSSQAAAHGIEFQLGLWTHGYLSA